MFRLKPMSAHKIFFTCSCLAAILSWNCNSGKNEKPLTPEKIIYKVDTSAHTGKPTVAKKPPIININDTIAIPRIIIYMKDSARSSERIGLKLTNIYNKVLPDVIKKNNLTKTGSRMAWFKNSSAPFFFEAGIPVNKKPAKLPKNVFEIGRASCRERV